MRWFFLLSFMFHAGVLALPLTSPATKYNQVIPIEVVTGFEKPAGKAAPERIRSSPGKRLTAPGLSSINRNQPDGLKSLPDARPRPAPAATVELPARDQQAEITDTAPPAAEISPVEVVDRTENIFFAETDTGRELSTVEPEPGSWSAFGDETGPGKSRNEPAASQPLYTYTPKPEYPDQARRQGWEGTVLLRVLVGAYGRPEKIEISRSSGYRALDGAAQKAVQRWRFHPASSGGRDLESWVRIPIVFRLED